tara:strand:+ start:719 stop:2905 length:2187 start_codon:yes stop_codon:yes gene_type:complete
MRLSHNIYIIALFLLAPLSTLFAQENIDDEIVVISSRIPTVANELFATVDTITQSDIDLQLIDDLSEMTRFIPGVSASRESQYGRSFLSDINIRGIGSDRVIMMIDGVRISDAYTGYGRDLVDTDLLKRIEISKGPTSAQYGSDGLAGIVGYFTKDPSDLASIDNNFYSINLATKQANKQSKVNFLAASVGEKFDALIQLTQRNMEETRLHDDFMMNANPFDGDQTSFLAKTVFRPTQGVKLTFTADTQKWTGNWDIKSEEGMVFFPSPPRAVSSSLGIDDGKRNRLSFRLNLSSEVSNLYDEASFIAFTQKTEQQQVTQQQQVTFFDGMELAPTPTMRDKNFQFNQSLSGVTFQAHKVLNSHQILYGFDYEVTDTERPRLMSEKNLVTQMVSNTVDGDTFPNKTFPDSESKRTAIFLSDRINFSESQIFTFGVRFDNYELIPTSDQALVNANPLNHQISSIDDSAISLKIGYLQDLNSNLTFFSQYSEGFRAPDYESANIVFTNFMYYYTVLPNPNLKPESSRGIEIGLRGSNDVSDWKMSIYKNDYDDFIQTVLTGVSQTGLANYQYQNTEDADIHGIEFQYNRAITENIMATLSFNQSVGDGNGESMNEVDPKEAILGLNWKSSNRKWGIQGMMTLVDKSKNDLSQVCEGQTCAPRAVIPGYGLLDLFLSYDFNENTQLRISAENVTNKKYHRWASVALLPEDDEELDLFGEAGSSINASFKYIF